MTDPDDIESAGGTVAQLHRGRTTRRSVYDEISELLVNRGWVQGRSRRGTALSLRTAIDEAVGIDAAGGTAPDGPTLARSGRIAAHLRDLSGARNLDAWSDDPQRTIDDVLTLLASAAVGFEDD